MIKPTILCSALILFVSTAFASGCEDSYQNASYGLQHVKKALEANNTTHLKAYAVRSKAALEKVLAATKACGCIDANYATYDALDNLDRALEKDKFEDIRFLVSKTKSLTRDTLVALDLCNAKKSGVDYESEEENLIQREKQLREQQQQLIAQQQELEAQIAEQKALQKKIQEEREAMLKAQKELQLTAEDNLGQMEQVISSFLDSMGCLETAPLTSESYKRNTAELTLESLGKTKAFYIEKAQEMASTLVNRLSKCEVKE